MSQPEPRERSSSRSRRAMSLPCLSTRAKSEGSYEGALLPDIVLYETAGWISHPRVAPDGKTVAFIDHPTRGDDAGAVAIVEPGKPARQISAGWLSLMGLAWSPDAREVWFTATRSGS